MAHKEIIVQDCQEYLARLKIEDFDGLNVPFLHLEFRRWTPRSFKRLLEAWSLFRKTVRGTFFALSNGDDINKWRKFVERLGFEYYKDIPCPDGKVRPCYVSWDITNG
jgi:hypothetical protein